MPATRDEQDEHIYKMPPFGKFINSIVEFVFYYRLVFVLIALIIGVLFTIHVWEISSATERVKNAGTTFTFATLIVGVFYAILNYEYNQNKYRTDLRNTRKKLSYDAIKEWNSSAILENLKKIKRFRNENDSLIKESRSADFSEKLDKDLECRASLLCILNHLECLAIGIEQEVLDEVFAKSFYLGIVHDFQNDYGFYISYRRKEIKNNSLWEKFSWLVERWKLRG